MTDAEMKEYMKSENYSKHIPHVVKAVGVYKKAVANWQVTRPMTAFSELRKFAGKFDLSFDEIAELCDDYRGFDYKAIYKKVSEVYDRKAKAKYSASKDRTK